MKNNYISNQNQMPALRNLISAHREFQEQLDIITSMNNNPEFVDLLIETRRLNINITNRYCTMIVGSQFDLPKPSHQHSVRAPYEIENEMMWKIHYELSIIIQKYDEIISSNYVSDFNKKIIARNLDQIIFQKDELLHPIKQYVA
jgi:hypothetical protein